MNDPVLNVRRIVCGVDFSEASVAALQAAANLARLSNAELHVLHVIEVHPRTRSWLPEGGQDGQADELSLEQKAATAMDALVGRLPRALDAIAVTTEITTGLAVAELLNRVRDPVHDLIVVGARGVTLLEDAVLGGTAEQVVKDAPCSVLVVRVDRSPT